MANYAVELSGKTDAELIELLGLGSDGSPKQTQVKFEMQRRAMVAQNAVADATKKYTRYTFCILIVTFLSVVANLAFQIYNTRDSNITKVRIVR